MDVAELNLTSHSAQHEFPFRKGTLDEGLIVQVRKTGADDHGRLRRGSGPRRAGMREPTCY